MPPMSNITSNSSPSNSIKYKVIPWKRIKDLESCLSSWLELSNIFLKNWVGYLKLSWNWCKNSAPLYITISGKNASEALWSSVLRTFSYQSAPSNSSSAKCASKTKNYAAWSTNMSWTISEEWTNITKTTKSTSKSEPSSRAISLNILIRPLRNHWNWWLSCTKEIFGLIIELSTSLPRLALRLRVKTDWWLLTSWWKPPWIWTNYQIVMMMHLLDHQISRLEKVLLNRQNTRRNNSKKKRERLLVG